MVHQAKALATKLDDIFQSLESKVDRELTDAPVHRPPKTTSSVLALSSLYDAISCFPPLPPPPAF